MSRIDELRAQLAMAETEQELIDAKAAANTPEIAKLREKVRKARQELREALADGPDLTAVKEKVRTARQAAREARQAAAPAPVEDDN